MKLLALLTLAACSGAPSPLDAISGSTGGAAKPKPTDIPATLDAIVKDVMAETGVPSVSLAAVSGGKIVYVHAYGDARIAPAKVAATPQMRYPIGSVAKQLTAAAILLLAEDGKLTLDDPVGKYVPDLTRGDQVTIRQILSHTSGYRDYAPQDYMIPEWRQPIEPAALVAKWAHAPLDFEPGTQYQYSNTNFVIAALIVEKLAGQPLFDFLKARVFAPLGMTSAIDVDRGVLAPTDPAGYFRRANGPPHEVAQQGAGWKLGSYELGMTAEDLAKWDIAVMDQKILSPASWQALTRETVLANGAGTRYGLGIGVRIVNARRTLEHGGEDNGFVSDNLVLPDDKLAIAVLTNQDASAAAGDIAQKAIDALVRAGAATSVATDEHVAALLADFAQGKLDRALLTSDANSYFTDEAIREYAAALAAAGAVQRVEQVSSGRRGGMTVRRYKVTCAAKALTISLYETDDGKLEQFLIE